MIIVAVKTHQLESLVPDLNRLTHDETTIILAQMDMVYVQLYHLNMSTKLWSILVAAKRR